MAQMSRFLLPPARLALALSMFFGAAPLALAATPWPNLPPTPIAIQAQADPNILVTLDDSGSMAWAYVPDNLYGSIGTTKRYLSWRVNPLAYNPFTVYEQPYRPALDGSRFTTSFSTAWINGYDSSRGSVNLASAYKPVYSYNPASTSQSTIGTAQAAYFYAFYNDLGPGNTLPVPGTDPNTFARNTVAPGGCPGVGGVGDEDCYVKIVVPAAHQQNFANWYSFYKTRNLMTVSAANLAFFDMNPNYRITWQALNTCNSGFNTTCNGWNGTNYQNNFRPLSNTSHKQTFYNWLSRLPASGGTPLRPAVQRAGNFFLSTGTNSPRAADPGVVEAPISTCRANFHLAMTDGIWNSGTVSIGNVDNSGRTLPDSTSYSPRAPYRDGNSDNIADLAFKYWAEDLQPGVANELIPYYVSGSTDYWDARNDPATWQHLVTFTVGLGLGSWLTPGSPPAWGGDMYSGDYPNLVAGTVAWPATADNSTGNVADLWHAAINSRGMFFNADSPQSIKSAFQQILNRIKANATSLGQIGSSTSRVSSDTVSVDSKFVPGDWYSTLTAYAVNEDGTRGAVVWNSDTSFVNESGRNIFTSVNGSGTAFDTAFFSTYGSSRLGTADPKVFNWLRGVRTDEGTLSGAMVLRVRKQLLGDIVGADLIVTGKDDFGYKFIPDAGAIDYNAARSSYQSYVLAKRPVVFASANDGMLHAFDARNGREIFAYVPTALHSKLRLLADRDYVHDYYVDGALRLQDVYLAGSWRTILVGGLGAGGRGWFGLDVTSVVQGGSFSSGNVIFDLSFNSADTNLRELGFALTSPVITRTITGEWVVLIANGYGDNSAPYLNNNCRAQLLIYSLNTNTLTKRDTGVGSCAVGQYNGLSSPAGLEYAAGNMVGVYAGDFQGNVWKIMLDINTGLWKAPVLFFTARDSSAKRQPITAPPLLKKHPGGGVMVLFGTGKFLEAADRSDRSKQTIYGLRDTGISISGRSQLVQQSITYGAAIDTATYRLVSNNDVDWIAKEGWYLDLDSTLFGLNSGERVVAGGVLNYDLALFNTYAPGANTCTGAGAGFLMALNTFTGGVVPKVPLFDLNNDGKIDINDLIGSAAPAGMKIAGQSLKSPSTMMVSTTAAGGDPGSGPPPTCGASGMTPCIPPAPPCLDNLTVIGGLCVPMNCAIGNIQVSSGGTPVCMSSETLKYPRWIELN